MYGTVAAYFDLNKIMAHHTRKSQSSSRTEHQTAAAKIKSRLVMRKRNKH